MVKRILILGSTGQLGSELLRVGSRASWEMRGLSHQDVEVTNPHAVAKALDDFRPQAVINTTAYNRVEEAETDPLPAFALNSTAVARLAQLCREREALLVHFSTDYVFNGRSDRPWREEDSTQPMNAYGLSKLHGEHAIRLLQPRHLILRTCGVYGHARSPGSKMNFADTMVMKASRGEALRVRDDLVCTPTSASELADATGALLEREAVGTFHATNSGSCTWRAFAQEALRLAGIAREIEPLTGAEAGRPTRRPVMTVLDCGKLASLGVKMSPWAEALEAYMKGRRT